MGTASVGRRRRVWGLGLCLFLGLGFVSSAADSAGEDGTSTVFGLLAVFGLWACVSNGPWAQGLRGRFMTEADRPIQQSSRIRESVPRPPDDLASAIALADRLRDGEGLGTIQPVFRLRDGELQHAAFGNVSLYEHFGVNVEYKTIHNTASHPVGWAIEATVHKAINNRNRERAEAEAAPRWREVCRGTLHVTSRRIVLDDGIELRSWWYETLVATRVEQTRLELRLEDSPGIVLGLAQAHVLLVLLHYLAWSDVPALPAA